MVFQELKESQSFLLDRILTQFEKRKNDTKNQNITEVFSRFLIEI